jgi:hypothetical protein
MPLYASLRSEAKSHLGSWRGYGVASKTTLKAEMKEIDDLFVKIIK